MHLNNQYQNKCPNHNSSNMQVCRHAICLHIWMFLTHSLCSMISTQKWITNTQEFSIKEVWFDCVSGSSRWCHAIRPQITINQHKSLKSLQLVFQSNQTVASITKSITDETNQLASTTPETSYRSHTPLIHDQPQWTCINTNAVTSSDVHNYAITQSAITAQYTKPQCTSRSTLQGQNYCTPLTHSHNAHDTLTIPQIP